MVSFEVDPVLWLELTAIMGLAVASHFTIKKFQQPTLVGEILIGLVVGTIAAALGTGPPFRSGIISVLGLLGAVILLFAVGLESDLKGIYSSRNVAVAMAGVILPWVGGFLLADRAFPDLFVPTVAGGPAACTQDLGYFCTPLQAFAAKVFVGSTLVATSVAITASVLHETGKIRTPTAQTILGAAVVDDVLGMIVLALSVGVAGGGIAAWDVARIVGAAVVFIGVAAVVGGRYVGRFIVWVQIRGLALGLKHSGFLMALVTTFFLAFISQVLGLSPIIGAFIAGTMFARTPLRDDFREYAENLEAIFTPLFFISIGLFADLLGVVGTTPLLLFFVALTVVAILTKFIGCGLTAWLLGHGPRGAATVGIGMAPRGEVALIIALFALTSHVISPTVFTVVVLMSIFTTLIPPLFLRRLLQRNLPKPVSARAPTVEEGDVVALPASEGPRPGR